MASADPPHSDVRILLVHDFDPWRQQICSKLKTQPEMQVVGEASDGLEAVHMAEELKPDLILFDIGLPNLNEIEAAKRLCHRVPGVKILFITHNNDAEMERAALSNGEQGYVLNTDAGRELLHCLRDEKFVSSGMERADFSNTENTHL
jgi:DNA-binding NarL/FixJ family response regulator